MSLQFVSVNWNRQKRIYDALVTAGVIGAVVGFTGATMWRHPSATIETALIRALGLTAFLALTVVLSIGPAARLDRRFLPLLYNRRHLGVVIAILGLAHAGFALVQYHAAGNLDPLASLFAIPALDGWPPFEWFGLAALTILLLMAATSHDYWLSALTPPIWKRLHMLVYPAYLALLFHIGWGLLQSERSPGYLLVLVASASAVATLHWAAARREAVGDREAAAAKDWVDLGPADRIAEGRAIIGLVAGERVAVFRHEGRLSCVSNVCKHQNGPLGEGRIVDGCITCPWHGYQYRPDTGTSPPPFTDKIPTFNLTVSAGRVLVDPVANPPGTRVEPVPADTAAVPADGAPFYVGYQPAAPAALVSFLRAVVGTVSVLAVGVMVALAVAQQGFDAASFEYGTRRTVEGVIRAAPFPVLEVTNPGSSSVGRYLLAAAGKHGAQAAVAGLDGRRARIVGSLAHRDNLTVLEIASAEPISAAGRAAPVATSRGRFELVGEIVDSKCYAGVMNPGRGATHRGCAVRCLSGGLTPLLVVKDADGRALELIVTDHQGHPVADLSRWTGRPVRMAGDVSVTDDLWYLQVDPSTIAAVR